MPSVQGLLADADARDPSFGVLVRLAITTGMRRGELCELRWCDIDLERRRIKVNRAVVAVPNGPAPAGLTIRPVGAVPVTAAGHSQDNPRRGVSRFASQPSRGLNGR